MRQRSGGSVENDTPGQLFVHSVSCTKEGDSSQRPEVPIVFCDLSTFQNGRYPNIQEPCETRILVGESRPKGRLFVTYC